MVDSDLAEELGKFRWHLGWRGYVMRTDNKRGYKIRLHRVILGLADDDQRQGDHINGNKLDNRRCNLRIVDQQGNNENRVRSVTRNGIPRGVSFHKETGKWQASIQVRGKSIYLGLYESVDQAGQAAMAARSELLPHAVND